MTSRSRARRAAASAAAVAAGHRAARPAPEGFSNDPPAALAVRVARPWAAADLVCRAVCRRLPVRRLRLERRFRPHPARAGRRQHARLGRPRCDDRGRRADLRIPHHRPGARAARPRLCADRAALQSRPLGQRAARIRLLQRSAESAAVQSHRISLQAAQGLSPLGGVGLCADRHRFAQRRRAAAAVLRGRHPRHRHGPAAQGELGARVEPQPARTGQRHRPQQGERRDHRVGVRRAEATCRCPIATRSSGWWSRCRRRARPTPTAPSRCCRPGASSIAASAAARWPCAGEGASLEGPSRDPARISRR